MSYLADALKDSPKLTHLYLRGESGFWAHNIDSKIDDDGVKILAESLTHNTTLQFLDLKGFQKIFPIITKRKRIRIRRSHSFGRLFEDESKFTHIKHKRYRNWYGRRGTNVRRYRLQFHFTGAEIGLEIYSKRIYRDDCKHCTPILTCVGTWIIFYYFLDINLFLRLIAYCSRKYFVNTLLEIFTMSDSGVPRKSLIVDSNTSAAEKLSFV